MTTELGLPDDRSSVDGGKDRMEYRVLGPVEARRDGELLDLGTKQRSLLALLLVEANRVVSIDRIIDELWGVDAGRDRQNALRASISKLRSTLEPDRTRRNHASILVTRPPGYMLVAAPDDIDAHRFEELTREGRSLLDVDPGAASILLSEALALWRGRAFEEYTYESFSQPPRSPGWRNSDSPQWAIASMRTCTSAATVS